MRRRQERITHRFQTVFMEDSKRSIVDNSYKFLDFEKLTPQQCYRYLVNLVFPRPIAFITTMDADGNLNAAPFSFFNALGGGAPQIMVSIEQRYGGAGPKDTWRNIKDTGEFVVNMVSESLLDPMNICATDFPPHVDELAVAGLETIPSTRIKPPRISESPVQFECLLHSEFKPGDRTFLFGSIVAAHVMEEAFDAETNRIRGELLELVGRTYDRDGYTNCRGVIRRERFSVEDFPEVGDQ